MKASTSMDAKISRTLRIHLAPLLGVLYVIAFLDRINISFAAFFDESRVAYQPSCPACAALLSGRNGPILGGRFPQTTDLDAHLTLQLWV